MRQFTPWAQALGGFLAHHGIDGFLTNIADVRGIDEDETRWRAFLACWHDRHGDKESPPPNSAPTPNPITSTASSVDRWDGQFITTHTGRLPNPLSLGRLLTGQTGRWRGDYVHPGRQIRPRRPDRVLGRAPHDG